MKISHHVAARLDVLEIVEHYENTAGTDIAADFFNELLTCLAHIAERPESFIILNPHLRRANLHRFPYNIIFEIGDRNTIQIFSVRHDQRDPNYGLDRT